MKDIRFKWYVLNDVRWKSDFDDDYHFNGNIKPWNIFDNWHVNEETNKLCREYKSKKMTFDEFTERLRKIIMWQEWSRCEYEILVGSLFPREGEREQKIDCYCQAYPNIRLIAEYVLREYYPKTKIDVHNENYGKIKFHDYEKEKPVVHNREYLTYFDGKPSIQKYNEYNGFANDVEYWAEIPELDV